MKNDLIQIRRFVPADWDALVKNAAEDQHSGVYAPTHVSVKNGEIVGYLSLGSIQSVLCWQHREKVGPLDSTLLLGFIKACLPPVHMIPCDPESPYNKLLPKAGYVAYTKPVTLYVSTNPEVKTK
jgi:hypothetical protein